MSALHVSVCDGCGINSDPMKGPEIGRPQPPPGWMRVVVYMPVVPPQEYGEMIDHDFCGTCAPKVRVRVIDPDRLQ